MTTVGVIALQGNFGKHCSMLSRLGVTVHKVLSPSDLSLVSALLIPGGESTSIIRQIQRADLFQPIAEFATTKPVFGTCAGSILMARHVFEFDLPTFGLIDIQIQRNAYGRQRESVIDTVEFEGHQLEVAFIRAPKIIDVGPQEAVLARWRNDPVIVRNKNHMVATCHPELLDNTSVHAYFLDQFL